VTVLLVDWLGRGGIAHCTDAWARELMAKGHEVAVATRRGRELADGPRFVTFTGSGRGRIGSHRAVIAAAIEAVRQTRPHTVVIQNYVLPPLEHRLHQIARRSGARVVFVIHDDRLHSRFAGVHLRLPSMIRDADVVVAHSRFVADAIARGTGRADIEVVPLPVFESLLSAPAPEVPVVEDDDASLAINFGVLKRGYKGTAVIIQLARTGVPGWRFAVLGAGAPADRDIISVPRFLTSGELVDALHRAHAVLLPYTKATQSGAVALAQTLGVPPVVTAVGGIPEQVTDGATGRLIASTAGVDEWRRVLLELSDAGVRDSIGKQARDAVWCGHAAFVESVQRLAT
jgi:glycosyltransferase involved in cell wall biosynthesis